MGIFSRIADIFKANVNDVLDQSENPEKMIKQMVVEMEESINKTTMAVAQAIANEKGLEKKIKKAVKDAENWEQKAMQALQANREDLATQALEKKSLAVRTATDLQNSYTQATATATKLRGQLDMLKGKLDEARARESTLIARSQAAKAQKQIAKSISGVGGGAFGSFDKYESKIEKLEAEAEAYEQLGDGSVALEDEFKQLESNANAENDLLALKQKMGLLNENNQGA